MTLYRFARSALVIAFTLAAALGADAAPIDADLAWAYVGGPKVPLPEAPPGNYSAPGSKLIVPAAVLNDHPVDWFPAEHPPAPAIVAVGGVRLHEGCATCHDFNGAGFAALPDLAGLKPDYILAQIQAFRAGKRVSSEPGRPNTNTMIEVATKVSDDEAKVAAAYFASLKRPRWYRVVESSTAPATRGSYYGWREVVDGGAGERLGNRIVEVAEDAHSMFWLQDPHSGVIAYVPLGSVSRGEALVRAAGCGSCHGAALRGAGAAPPLAGRSPGYLAREIWDIRTGARADSGAAPMRQVAASLTGAQVTDIVAYLAAQAP